MDTKKTNDWAPERLYLQRGVGEGGSHTWCEDSIDKDSIGEDVEQAEYVRVDVPALSTPAEATQAVAPQFKWTAFADALPPTKSNGRGDTCCQRVLVTNNMAARDAFGDPSHIWYGSPMRDAEGWRVYEGGRFLTHWMDPFDTAPQALADAARAEPANDRATTCPRCRGTGYHYEWCPLDVKAPQASTAQQAVALTDATCDVLAERRRQVVQEGWTPEHDDAHDSGEMALAAAAYASESITGHGGMPGFWPWACEWWKPGAGRRMLVKAGALILAEIERLDRAAARTACDS